MIDSNQSAIAMLPVVIFASSVYAADYLTVEQAQQVLFPDAQRFVPEPVLFSDDQKKAIKKLSGMRQRWDRQEAWRAQRDAAELGWMLVDNVVGKHEFITYAAAISPGGEVLGIEILSYRETHGGEVRQADWRAQFQGKTLADPFKLDRDVANISGATLSCRNLLDGVKRLLAIHQVALRDE